MSIVTVLQGIGSLQELLKCAQKQSPPSQTEINNLQKVIGQLEVSMALLQYLLLNH